MPRKQAWHFLCLCADYNEVFGIFRKKMTCIYALFANVLVDIFANYTQQFAYIRYLPYLCKLIRRQYAGLRKA